MPPRVASPRRPAHERRRSHTRGGDRSPAAAASNGTTTAVSSALPSPPPPILQPAATNSIIVQEYHGSEATPACYRFSSQDPLARLEHASADGSVASSAPSSANLPFLRRWLASIVAVFTSLFLPVGYPQSVTPDYAEFQLWDTVQAMSSYLRGMLCTHAVLTGLGVGEASASATSATVNWVLRDGLGMFGSLLFAAWGSAGFGSNIQGWRLFADVINDVGLTLELVSPLFPREYFFAFLVAGCLCRSLCGVAAGSTRAALMQHFARVGNMADLAAKEGSQETFVTLLGMVGGALLMRWIDGDARATWMLFAALTALHVYANWRGVRALVLCSLNPQRTDLLLRDFCTQLLRGTCSAPRLLRPAEVARRERLVWVAPASAARDIRLGAPLHSLVSSAPLLQEVLAAQHHADNADYILCPLTTGAVGVVLRAAPSVSSSTAAASSAASSSASSNSGDLTMLRALFHAHLYRAMLQRGDGAGTEQAHSTPSSLQAAGRYIVSALTPRFFSSSSAAASSPRTSALSSLELRSLRTSGILCTRQWPIVLDDLARHGWTLEHLALDNEGWRCQW